MMPSRSMRRRWRRPIAVGSLAAVVMASALASCGGSSKGVGRLTVSGVVQYAAAHSRLHSIGSGQMLSAGDQVQVTSGSASIRLSPSGLLELRTGTTMTINKVIRLTGGSVLIEPSGHPIRVSGANATLVVPAGAAQLMLDSRGSAGLTAKVYQDKSSLQIPGNPELGIVAPRQANLTIQSKLPIPAVPLAYQDDDPWDRRYLGTVEAFSRQLTAAATGFNAQLPTNQVTDAGFYQQLLPGLGHQSDYGSAFQVVQSLPPASEPLKPGDSLIALAMALRGTRGSFEDRLRQEVAFRSVGADWALIAVDQGMSDLGGLLNDVLAAIGRASLPLNTPGTGQVAVGPQSTTSPTTAGARPGSGGRVTPTTGPATQPAAPGSRAVPTPTTVAPLLGHLPKTGTPLDPILDPLIDPLIDLLNNLLAGHH